MKLISCPECGKQVSVNATKCVHCGFPLPLKTCPECGAQYNAVLSVCPQCGHDEVAAKEQAEQLAKHQAEQARIAAEQRAIKVAKARRIGKIVGIVLLTILLAVVSVITCRYVKDKRRVEAAKEQGFVDLGLPSGTMWKSQNEGGFYTYSCAVELFETELPTATQFEELKNVCEWEWIGNGYKVIGPNSDFIILPASGWRRQTGDEIEYVGYEGYYWSSSPYMRSGSYLFFKSDDVFVIDNNLNATTSASILAKSGIVDGGACVGGCEQSIRLVCNPKRSKL